MNKTVIAILSMVIIILVLILSKYYQYKEQYKIIQEFNIQFEEYLDKEVYGNEIATIVNKVVDNNETNYIEKDDDGKYIPNEYNYINVEIKITDLEEETIYNMETLYNGGMTQFVQYYNSIKFKCTRLEYNSNKRVKYMLFEQISN